MIKNISFAIAIIFAFSFTKSYAEETWKITSLDWQPYSGADMTSQGNSIQKLREILKGEGINLIVEYYPWKRAKEKARQSDYVGFFPAWPEEVMEGFFASPPIDWSTIDVLGQAKKKINFKDIDGLFSAYRVGYVKTYVYPDLINAAVKKYPNNAIPASHELTLLNMLASGRFDVALTDANVMLYLAEKEGVSNIETIGDSLMKKELVLAFRNGDDNLKRLEILKKLLNY